VARAEKKAELPDEITIEVRLNGLSFQLTTGLEHLNDPSVRESHWAAIQRWAGSVSSEIPIDLDTYISKLGSKRKRLLSILYESKSKGGLTFPELIARTGFTTAKRMFYRLQKEALGPYLSRPGRTRGRKARFDWPFRWKE
jgi:hypothetical protein